MQQELSNRVSSSLNNGCHCIYKMKHIAKTDRYIYCWLIDVIAAFLCWKLLKCTWEYEIRFNKHAAFMLSSFIFHDRSFYFYHPVYFNHLLVRSISFAGVLHFQFICLSSIIHMSLTTLHPMKIYTIFRTFIFKDIYEFL